MMKRRDFLQILGLAPAAKIFGNIGKASAMDINEDKWVMPDESEPHRQTWMAFGASKKVWGRKLLPEVQRNLANIALSIAEYEPVSMLVRQSDLATAKNLMGSKIDLVVCPLDDLWIRDTGPIFIVNEEGEKKAIDFNFNGWGEKQDYYNDGQVAAFVAKHSGHTSYKSNLILEGGGIEVDGYGTAIITESCVINKNRNPGLSKAQCEEELKRNLGLKKIIWLPGIKGKDITDGHTDFYARFAGEGVVVAAYDPDPESFDHAVTKKHLAILQESTDAFGRELEVVVLHAPLQIRNQYAGDKFAAGYVNYYICNGALILPEFGDKKADADARKKLENLFPERNIVQLNIDGIAAGGGGIHCTTMQEPIG
jgi:agmatine deiminase